MSDRVRITVRAKPRAKKTRVVKAEGLSIEVALAAPPVDGAANEELVRAIAEALALPKRDVALVQGASSKNKVVEVCGLAESVVSERLAACAAG